MNNNDKTLLNQNKATKQVSENSAVDSYMFDDKFDFPDEIDKFNAGIAGVSTDKQISSHDNPPVNEDIIIESSFTKSDYDNTASFNFNEEIRRQMLELSDKSKIKQTHQVQIDVESEIKEAERIHGIHESKVNAADNIEAVVFDFNSEQTQDNNDLNTTSLERSIALDDKSNIDSDIVHTEQVETLFVDVTDDEVLFEGSDCIEVEQFSHDEVNNKEAENIHLKDLESADTINVESNDSEELIFAENTVVDSKTEEVITDEHNHTRIIETTKEINSITEANIFQEDISEIDIAQADALGIKNEDSFEDMLFELPESSVDTESEETQSLFSNNNASTDDEFDFSEFEEDKQEETVLRSESDTFSESHEKLEADSVVFASDSVVEKTEALGTEIVSDEVLISELPQKAVPDIEELSLFVIDSNESMNDLEKKMVIDDSVRQTDATNLKDEAINQNELDDEKSIISDVEDTLLFADSAEDNKTAELMDNEVGDVFTAITEAKTDTESFKAVQIDNTQLDTKVTAKNNLPKAVARLIRYLPQRYFALPTFATIEIIEKPEVTFIPCMKPYVYGMLSWQNTSIPMIDIGGVIMNDNTPSNTRTSHSNANSSKAANYALVVAYIDAKTKAMKHIAIALDETPSSVMVDDSMMADLPTDSPIWQEISVSCFEHQGQPVPIVNTNLLFG